MLIEAGLLKEWYGSHKDKFIESSTVMKEEPVVSESTITEDTSHSGQEMTSCSKETVIMVHHVCVHVLHVHHIYIISVHVHHIYIYMYIISVHVHHMCTCTYVCTCTCTS